MAKPSIAFSLLLVLSVASCLALLPLASAGLTRHIARTRQAHEQFRRQRRLIHLVDRGMRPPLHLFETRTPAEAKKMEDGGPISYRGGPVMTNAINVYLIYYGDWPEASGQGEIENFIWSLSGESDQQGDGTEPQVKSWWAINAPYYQEVDGTQTGVSTTVSLAGTTYDSYSAGQAFSKDTPWEVISSKIGEGKDFPYDPNGIYMLLTSPDVTIPDYCIEFCGYHTMNYIGSDAVIYSLVGHHGQCAESCWAQSVSPSGNPAIDATISTIAHELAEAATDPDVQTGWIDDNNEENADKCSGEYGDALTDTDYDGATYEYNLVGLGGVRYRIQQNWDREENVCVSQA